MPESQRKYMEPIFSAVPTAIFVTKKDIQTLRPAHRHCLQLDPRLPPSPQTSPT